MSNFRRYVYKTHAYSNYITLSHPFDCIFFVRQKKNNFLYNQFPQRRRGQLSSIPIVSTINDCVCLWCMSFSSVQIAAVMHFANDSPLLCAHRALFVRAHYYLRHEEIVTNGSNHDLFDDFESIRKPAINRYKQMIKMVRTFGWLQQSTRAFLYKCAQALGRSWSLRVLSIIHTAARHTHTHGHAEMKIVQENPVEIKSYCTTCAHRHPTHSRLRFRIRI